MCRPAGGRESSSRALEVVRGQGVRGGGGGGAMVVERNLIKASIARYLSNDYQ